MLAVARNKAFLHHWRQSSIQLLVNRSRQYSREWNEWKHSEERTVFLQRNERIAIISTGVTVVIGLAAIKGVKMYSSTKSSPGAGSVANGRPLVLAGPSGSGKSTLLKRLFAEFQGEVGFSVSHTTRKPREGERNGKEYHFVTREMMQSKIDDGQFIEHAVFSGNMYGTSKQAVKDVMAQGKICVLDIDMQGVRSLKKTDLNPVFVLVKPPSLEVLEQRLRGRGTDSAENIEKRLKVAKEELEFGSTPGVFDHVITNDVLEDSYEQLKKIFINDVKLSAAMDK